MNLQSVMCWLLPTAWFSSNQLSNCKNLLLNVRQFHHRLNSVLVRLGEYDSSRALDCTESDDYNEAECADPVQDINIRSFIAHPGFGHNRLEMIHDIGLVQLDEAANFKQKNIKPICLPFTQTLQTLPSKFLAIGWGLNEKRQKPSILQKASLPLYDSFACQRELSRIKKKASTVVEGQFCAGGEGLSFVFTFNLTRDSWKVYLNEEEILLRAE